jgi:hypothetical protein
MRKSVLVVLALATMWLVSSEEFSFDGKAKKALLGGIVGGVAGAGMSKIDSVGSQDNSVQLGLVGAGVGAGIGFMAGRNDKEGDDKDKDKDDDDEESSHEPTSARSSTASSTQVDKPLAREDKAKQQSTKGDALKRKTKKVKGAKDAEDEDCSDSEAESGSDRRRKRRRLDDSALTPKERKAVLAEASAAKAQKIKEEKAKRQLAREKRAKLVETLKDMRSITLEKVREAIVAVYADNTKVNAEDKFGIAVAEHILKTPKRISNMLVSLGIAESPNEEE